MYGYIYKTTNLVNGKIYIGKHKHEGFDPYYYGSGPEIRKALKKYGKKNFKVEVLQEVDSLQEANQLEMDYIEEYTNLCGLDNMYNTDKGGNGGDTQINMTEEEHKDFVERMTKINRERCQSEEFRKMRSYEGRKFYQEHPEEREKVSKRFKEYWADEDTKKMRSEKLKKYYREHPEMMEHINQFKYKPLFLEVEGETIYFDGVGKMKEYLKEKYDYTPDFKAIKKMTDAGRNGPGKQFFHKKFRHLNGMKIYFDDSFGVETRGDECSPVGNEIGTFSKRETPRKIGNRKYFYEDAIEVFEAPYIETPIEVYDYPIADVPIFVVERGKGR